MFTELDYIHQAFLASRGYLSLTKLYSQGSRHRRFPQKLHDLKSIR